DSSCPAAVLVRPCRLRRTRSEPSLGAARGARMRTCSRCRWMVDARGGGVSEAFLEALDLARSDTSSETSASARRAANTVFSPDSCWSFCGKIQHWGYGHTLVDM